MERLVFSRNEEDWPRGRYRLAIHRFASIVRGIGIPVISILEVLAKETARIGAREVLILGTALTMRSTRFREEFAKYRVEAVGPHDETERSTAGHIDAVFEFAVKEWSN